MRSYTENLQEITARIKAIELEEDVGKKKDMQIQLYEMVLYFIKNGNTFPKRLAKEVLKVKQTD